MRQNVTVGAVILGAGVALVVEAHASDHLDTPTVTQDPAADIGDLFAWTSSDGKRVNLIMTMVGHRFSDKVEYAFHVDSGPRFGATTSTTTIVCRFDAASIAECWAGDADYVRGDASAPTGLEGQNRRFRVFAGLRDDPFFNNVKGTRAALNVAGSAAKGTGLVDLDNAGCATFDEATSRLVIDRWSHTDDGPAKNFLAGWKTSALVVSVNLDVVSAGGKFLAVWAGTYKVGP
jgi:hypothetical protein